MISIREYTKERGISYEAGRKCLRRYEESLEGHLEKDGRGILLDDEAVKFLDERRSMKKSGENRNMKQKNPVAQMQPKKTANPVNTVFGKLPKDQKNPASDAETENMILKERIENLEAALKREEEKNVKLETERVRMMRNDWDNPSKSDILKTGGCLTRHHYDALSRYEHPSLEGVTDVFFILPQKDKEKYEAGFVTIDVTELDRNRKYDRDRVLKKIGKSNADGKPVLTVAPGQVLAEALVTMYGPVACGGTAYDGTSLTAENIIKNKNEVMEWMGQIGAEEYLPEKERNTYLGSKA